MDFDIDDIDERTRQSVSDMKEFVYFWKFFMHIIDFPDYIFKEALNPKYSIKKTIRSEQTFDKSGLSDKIETHTIWALYNHGKHYLTYDSIDKTLEVTSELLDKLRAYTVERRGKVRELLFKRANEYGLP
jgi:hypothetical protein